MKKRIYLFFLGVCLCQLFPLPVFGVRSLRYPFRVVQPDGSKLTIRLHGDEFFHYQTTDDGFLVKQNISGFYRYATVDADGKVLESDYNAKDAQYRTQTEKRFLNAVSMPLQLERLKRAASVKQSIMRVKSQSEQQQAFPRTGSSRSLVILVNFSDKSFSVGTPQLSFTNLLNQSGYGADGATGSAKDYFMSSSYGKFSPVFDVVGPYTLPQKMDYYGANNGSGDDQNPRQMIIDACTQASANGVNFSQYDTNGDGFVDNVFVYYAGYNEAEGGAAATIWPHRWALANYGTRFNGKIIFDYACTSELRGASGTNMCSIGTFCHEFGHVIGLPDYYHTEDASGSKQTLGSWSIMDYGSYNNQGRTPPVYSSYDRFFLGWLTPQQISYASHQSLLPLYQGTTTPSSTAQQSYLISSTTHNLNGTTPNPAEFFMLEYRKKTGWDTYLPSEGMLFWHVDYDATAWDNNAPNNYTGTSQTAASHMRVYLQPLSGSTTTPGTAFSSGTFTPTTWSGVDLNRVVSSIVKNADQVNFDFMGAAQIRLSEIASPSSADIVVGSGIRFTSDVAGTTIKSLTAAPGSVLELANPVAVTGDVLLKSDNSSSFNAAVGAGATISGNLKYVKTIDDSHWYFLAFPCAVPISGIKKADGSSLGTLGTDWFIQYYDGASRVVNLGASSNWVNITNSALSLEANKGYAIGVRAGTHEVAFPLVKTLLSSESVRSIPVVAYGSSLGVGENHKGWNLISQPYLSKYNSANAGLNYMVFPADATAQTYQAISCSAGVSIDPFRAFFVQADAGMEASQVSFETAGRQSLPQSIMATAANEVCLNLISSTGLDNTNLILDDSKSPAYVIGQDMEKWIGVGTSKPQVYTVLGGISYSYNALPLASVSNLPLGYYTQTAGELTIGLAGTAPADLSRLLLTDLLTGVTTDLLTSSYKFTTVAGSNNLRFVLNTRNLETGLPEMGGEPVITVADAIVRVSNLRPQAVVQLFDVLGRSVACLKVKGGYLELPLHAEGVYTLVMNEGAKCTNRKFVYKR